MKKVILCAALVGAMMCFGNSYAAKPIKKTAKAEQTTAKKAEKKTVKKNTKKATKAAPAKKAAKKSAKAAK